MWNTSYIVQEKVLFYQTVHVGKGRELSFIIYIVHVFIKYALVPAQLRLMDIKLG